MSLIDGVLFERSVRCFIHTFTSLVQTWRKYQTDHLILSKTLIWHVYLLCIDSINNHANKVCRITRISSWKAMGRFRYLTKWMNFKFREIKYNTKCKVTGQLVLIIQTTLFFFELDLSEIKPKICKQGNLTTLWNILGQSQISSLILDKQSFQRLIL